jgi:hypothetical protein
MMITNANNDGARQTEGKNGDVSPLFFGRKEDVKGMEVCRLWREYICSGRSRNDTRNHNKDASRARKMATEATKSL